MNSTDKHLDVVVVGSGVAGFSAVARVGDGDCVGVVATDRYEYS